MENNTLRNMSIFGLVGVVLGGLAGMIMISIAVPSFNNDILPIAYHEELQRMAVIIELGTNYMWLLKALFFLVLLISWILIAGQLNPSFRHYAFWKLDHPWRAGISFLVGGVLFWACFLNNSLYGTIFSFPSAKKVLVALGFLAGTMAMTWLLVSPNGFARFGPEQLKSSRRQQIHTALLGASFGLFSGLLLYVTSEVVLMKYFQIAIEGFDRSMETSVFGFWLLTLGIMAIMALTLIIIYGFLPLFLPTVDAWKLRLNKAKPGWIALAVVTGILLVMMPILFGTFHINKSSLLQAVGEPDVKAIPLTLVRLCGRQGCQQRVSMRKGKPSRTIANKQIEVSQWKTKISTYGFFTGSKDVSVNESLVPKLEQFVLGDGRHSVFRKVAINMMPEVYSKLWRPRAAFHVYDNLSEKGELPYGPTTIWTISQVSWLVRSAPITDANRQDLIALSDPKRYYHGKKYAARLIRAWQRFGDKKRVKKLEAVMKKAKGWFNKQERELAELPLPTTKSGSISGRIVFDGVLTKGIRVGLFSLGPVDSKAKIKYPPRPTNLISVVGSQIVGESGAFSFKNLTDGDYALAMLVPAERLSSEDKLTGNNIPGIAKVMAGRTHVNLSLIRLRKLK